MFRDLVGSIAWHTAQERRFVQESWLTFKDHLLQAQEWSLLTCKDGTVGLRKAKTLLKLNLVKDIKIYKKGILQVYKQQQESCGKCLPAAKWGMGPVTKNTEKVKEFSVHFASQSFNGNSKPLKPVRKSGARKT